MHDRSQWPRLPLDICLWRTPLLPLQALEFTAPLDGGATPWTQRIRAVIAADSRIRAAIACASPDVAAQMDRWMESGGTDRKLERTLLKYVVRMATRCTPFGSFAGCAVGRLGSLSRLDLHGKSGDRHVRTADVAVIYGDGINDLVSDRRVRWSTAVCTYLVAGRRRLVALDHQGEHWRQSTITEAMWCRLAEACTTPKTIVEMEHALLARDPELDQDALRRVLTQCIEEGILIRGDEPPITRAPTRSARRRPPRDDVRGGHPRLVRIGRRAWHTELWRQARAADVSEATATALGLAAATLARRAPRREQFLLQQFADGLYERFGDEPVPLFRALDPESGIGFREQLLMDRTRRSTSELAWVGIVDEQAWRTHAAVVDTDLSGLLAGRTCELTPTYVTELLPRSFSVLASIGCSDSGEETALFKYAAGPTCLSLLARFGRRSRGLEEQLRRAMAAEERSAGPDELLADVVYRPRNGAGNVAIRPSFASYEIECFGTSGLPPARRIALSDLSVRAANGRVELCSTKLGKRVLPRALSAVRGAESSVYRFLVTLQYQDHVGAMFWDWGLLDRARCLPRVSVGPVVVSPARWRVDSRSIATGIRNARQHLGMPRYVNLISDGHSLFVDLESDVVAVMCDQKDAAPEMLFEEVVPQPHLSVAKSGTEIFLNEVLLPFVVDPSGRPAAER